MTPLSNGWRRVRKSSPCPICERPDWCLVSADGAVAICQRVESRKRIGDAGWLHRLQERPWQPARPYVRTFQLSTCGPKDDLRALAAQFREAVSPAHLDRFARSLGLSVNSLRRLGIGWSESHRAWSFPMADSMDHVIGIRLRRPNGFKFAVGGSHDGLFIPTGISTSSTRTLFICEGASDTAALLDMGFEFVAGRPSCTGGVKLLVDVVQRHELSDVVIVADADEPGRRGADKLASALRVYIRTVRVIWPPEGIADARDWLRAGGRRVDVEAALANAPLQSLMIRAKEVPLGR
jgi:hypothetical protein